MRITKSPLVTIIAFSTFSALVGAWNRDSLVDDDSLLGDVPAPTLAPLESYPYLPQFAVKPGLPGLSKANTVHSGRLDIDYRQTVTCSDPGYVQTCPVEENSCCPAAYPVCCPNPATNCCATGSFCVGTHTCCRTGTVACGEGCCDAGATCCGGSSCCPTGYTCQSGTCVNPSLSSQSVASLQSVASVQSESFASLTASSALAASSASVASVSSELVNQPGYSDSEEVRTVNVSPSDDRIEYDPASSWRDGGSSSGVGNCNNGTKVATDNSAKFKFVFKGTAISLFIVPSSAGGAFTVQIDGEPASSYSGAHSDGSVGDQCLPKPIYSRNNLTESPHEITVTNGGVIGGARGGTLEFNGITYTGKGAFGTSPKSSGPNAAVIGGSVGGAVGAVALIGGIAFWLWHKKKHQNTDAPTTTNTPAPSTAAMGQAQMIHPYSPSFQNQNQSTPGSPGAGSAYAYAAMAPMPSPNSQQPILGSQQYQAPGQQQQGWGQQPQWQGQQQQAYDRPISGHSASGSGIAPLPMWVERARGRDDGTSVISGGNASSQGYPEPNPYYGSHYSGNVGANNENHAYNPYTRG